MARLNTFYTALQKLMRNKNHIGCCSLNQIGIELFGADIVGGTTLRIFRSPVLRLTAFFTLCALGDECFHIVSLLNSSGVLPEIRSSLLSIALSYVCLFGRTCLFAYAIFSNNFPHEDSFIAFFGILVFVIIDSIMSV